MIVLPHAVFIYDETGNPIPVVSGSTLTSGSRGFVVYAKDGNNETRNFTVDTSGNLLITGSVAVVNFPETQTITGTVNVNNQPTSIIVTQETASNLNATITGTVTVQNIDVALSTRLSENIFTNSVGEVQTTPTANTVLGRLKNINDTASTLVTQAIFTSSINTLGQKTMIGSTPIVIASDQTVIPVSDNSGSLTIDNQYIDANLSTLLTTQQFTSSVGDVTITPADYTILGRLKDIHDTTNTLVTQAKFTSSVGEVVAEPADYTILGRLKDIVEQLSASINTLGQKDMSGSTAVVIASDQSEYPVIQGTSASLDGAWPVRVTDGTNILPTGDVQTRAIYNYITDGINNVVSVKTGSVSASINDNALVTALSPNTQLPSGSNTLGYVMQGLSASLNGRWPVIHTDGINTMPTLDSQTRAGFVKLTDGVNNVVTVRTGSSIASLLDNSLVVQISPNQQPIPTQVVPQTSVPGTSVGKVIIGANTLTAVRSTTFVLQTTNARRSFVSTSANDSSAGTGARQIRLTYLDSTGAGPFTETITMNGLTAVNTVATNICFVEKIEVTSIGSNGSNVGTINMYSTTGGTGIIIAAIGINSIISGLGDNETLYCHHFIPDGTIAKIYYLNIGSQIGGTATAQALLRARNPTISTSPEMLVSDFTTNAQGNSANRTFTVPIDIPGPSLITGYMITSNNGTGYLSFDWSQQNGN